MEQCEGADECVPFYHGPQVGTTGQQARENSCCVLVLSGFWTLTVSGIPARAVERV